MSDIFMPEPNMQLVRDVRERREERTQTSDGPMLDELANALESAQAELRQERERARSFREGFLDASKGRYEARERADRYRERAKRVGRKWAVTVDDLFRAEAAIEKVLTVPNEFEWDVPPTAKRILTEYDKQKGAERG